MAQGSIGSFLLVLSLGVLLPSIARAQWPNEPAGATVISDVDWSVCPPPGWDAGTAGTCAGAIASDDSAPLSPSSVLRNRLEVGQSTGGYDPFIIFPVVRTLYFAHRWFTVDPFYTPAGGGGNKLFIAFSKNSEYGVTIFGMMTNPVDAPYGPYTFAQTLEHGPILDNCHLSGWGDCPGSFNVFPNKGSGILSLGRWHTYETCMEASRGINDRTGVLKVWLDGALIADYSNVNTTPDGWNMVNITHTWDGSWTPIHPVPAEHRIDHTRVSTAAGCGPGGGGGDTTPPAAPQGLRAS